MTTAAVARDRLDRTHAQFLRTTPLERLSPFEKRTLATQLHWEAENHDATEELRKFIGQQVFLARTMHSFDGSVIPRGTRFQIIDHWRGDFHALRLPKELHLAATPVYMLRRAWVNPCGVE